MKNPRIIYALIVAILSFTHLLGNAQTSDSLSHYLEIAGQNNQNIKADFLRYQAYLQKIPQAGAYQDPQVDIGFFLKPMELVDGRQVGEFKIMQMFPWFGTRKAAQTEAQQMAKMSFEKFRETRNQLFFDVYSQWFVLCNLKQQLHNNRENLQLLNQLHTLATRRFSAPSGSGASYSIAVQPSKTSSQSPPPRNNGGQMAMGNNTAASSSTSSGMSQMGGSGATSMPASSGGMSDVLRIELEQAEIGNNIENLLSEMKAEEAKFNALLNREIHIPVAVPDSFEKTPFLLNAETAANQINADNPMLGMIDAETKSYEAKAVMDKKMSYPMFGVGIQYMLINKSNAASSSNSTMDQMNSTGSMGGMDMVMPMFSVTIPLYRGKYKAQQRENRLLRQAGIEKYAAAKQELAAEFFSEQQRLENANRKIALLIKQSELAQNTYQLALREFVSGKNDLSNVIQIQRELLGYQLRKSEAIAEYNTQVAAIQKLMSFEIKDKN